MNNENDICPIIRKSSDYDAFTFMEENREIRADTVQYYTNLFKVRNKMPTSPGKVTPDLKIIDGQHRFLACKNLGIPFYYVVDNDYDTSDLSMINISHSWQLKDFIHHFSVLGKPVYMQIEKLAHILKTSVERVVRFCVQDDGHVYPKIKRGALREEIDEEKIIKLFKFYEEFQQLVEKILFKKKKFHDGTKLQRSLIKLFNTEGFIPEVFFPKLEIHISKLHHCATQGQYYEVLLEIYNWKNFNKIGVRKIIEE